MGAFQAMPGVIVTTSSAMKCCDGNCVRRWPLTSFAIRTHLYLYDKGKGVCVRDVCAIYDNNISPSLLMIIIKIIILYFIQIRHTDAFPPTGTLLVVIIHHWERMLNCHPRFFEIKCRRGGRSRGRKSNLTRSLVASEGWSSVRDRTNRKLCPSHEI